MYFCQICSKFDLPYSTTVKEMSSCVWETDRYTISRLLFTIFIDMSKSDHFWFENRLHIVEDNLKLVKKAHLAHLLPEIIRLDF